MDHKENRARADGSERVPTFLLAIMKSVGLRQCKWIVKNLNRPLKADVMLDQVLATLRFVPVERHRENKSIVALSTYTCQYTQTDQHNLSSDSN